MVIRVRDEIGLLNGLSKGVVLESNSRQTKEDRLPKSSPFDRDKIRLSFPLSLPSRTTGMSVFLALVFCELSYP